ncbi:pilus assembly protein [Agromyces sp. ISL-38]|uniref:TadE/TadG family type IV pilus assembly protein n=1 Tax=Agromyces sp. ISL-38 TaxID=2819107 RepID=UPI001BED3908|nr:TadE/TadG family type IV pilus assembly protein [Agromyces sp. ISL-38]MBT2500745.1 pilus assembly protein [Agromyces sp. ISL-38]
MWRLTGRFRSERGASAVLVGILLVPLIGGAAITVDVGALYAERAQLQNSADAAALAVAADCAKGGCTNNFGVAAPYVDGNANDGASTPTSITFPSATSVTVAVETLDANAGDNTIKHPLAAVIGFDATTVHAQATAEWGVPVAGKTLNLAIAECEFDRATPQEGSENPVKMVIAWHENQHKDCPGTNPEGGFGWLVGTNCETVYDLSASGELWVSGETGIVAQCNLSNYVGTTVLIPIYSDISGVGANTKFLVTGFAAFHITGYKTSPGNPKKTATVDQTAPMCLDNKGKIDPSCVFIQGYFERYVSVAEYWELGTSTGDFDLDVVHLID